jgi:tetratricopeptide (TPR) repeat protein
MIDRPKALADALSAGPPPVLLLIGEPGSGRWALLESAAAVLRRGGRKVVTLDLDLDGFESDTDDSLARYLAARGVTQPGLADRAARLAPLATALPRSHRSAALLAVLLDPGADPGPADAAVDLPFEPRAALVESLRARTPTGGRLVLFARVEELTGPLAGTLAELPAEVPGLALALAVAPGDEAELRFLLPALDPAELPRFTVEPGTAGEDPLAPLAALFDRLELDAARELELFLDGAALLAPNAPADVAAFLAGRGAEEAEALLDRVDEELADGAAERILWDFEYGHPAFPGQPVYRFARPALARAIVDRLAPEERRRRAGLAFERLAPSLPADSRGRTRLLLALARTAELASPRRRLLAELALAFDSEEGAEAPHHVAAVLACGALAPGELLALTESTERRWPTVRRLALVAGLRSAALTPEEVAAQAMLEGRFLAELGRGAEATPVARGALAAAEAAFTATDPRVAAASNLLGLMLGQQGDFAAALPLLERTVEILRATPALDPGVLAGARARLGELLRRLGRPAEAREQFVAALELLRGVVGDAHPAVAAALNDLALASRDLGALDEAASFHRQALEVHRRALGPDHPNVALDWNNLGTVEQQRGRLDEARRAFEESVAVLGRHKEGIPPSLAVALANLAGVLFALERKEEACARLTEAARLAEQLLGAENPFARDLRRQVEARCG